MENKTPHCPVGFVMAPVAGLEIPLRYYRGWTVMFRVHDESFNSPLLSLYGFSSGKDLEKAMDYVLEMRGQNEP